MSDEASEPPRSPVAVVGSGASAGGGAAAGNLGRLLETYDRLLERYMPPGILVSLEGEVLHTFGGAEKYLRFRSGRPATRISDLLDAPLKFPVSVGIRNAIDTGETFGSAEAPLGDGASGVGTVICEPIRDAAGRTTGVFITFCGEDALRTPSPAVSPQATPAVPRDTEPVAGDIAEDDFSGQYVRNLETELEYTRVNLRAVVSELDASNEKLQASNEKLLAAKEQLQSVTEELHTVERDNKRRSAELAEFRAETDRLLEATRLRSRAADAASEGIVIVDTDADDMPIVYANEGFEKLTGYSRDEVLGRNCRFLQGPETDARAVETIRAALKHRRCCRVTLLNYRKGGEPFWSDLQLSPVADEAGKITHYVGIQRDVTEQIRNEQSVRQNEADYRSTFENAGIGIAHLDRKGRWVKVNKRLCEMLGYNRDELLGMPFNQVIDPEDVEEEVKRFRKLRRGRISGYSRESRYHRRDGRVVWGLLTASPRRGPDGKILGCIAVIEDVTQRKEAEQALVKARRMAESANRAKTGFLTNMSHELRTPMTSVLGFADMLSQEITDPDQLEKLKTLRQNGEYLLRLLDDILDLSRIESRRVRLETEPCDLPKLLGDVERLLQGRADCVGTQLEFHFPTQLPQTVYSSTSRLRQILVNLISNALKFTVNGKVDVVLRYEDTETELSEDAYPLGRRLELQIIDTGIGMDEEELDRLFQPIPQSAPTIARPPADTGLGLSITKRLVTALGGTITVTSQKGLGSSFIVRLPIAEAGELVTCRPVGNDAADDAPGIRLPVIQARILVADDRRDVWQVTKYFLERCGAEVAVAEDGRQAIEAVETAAADRNPFHLILLDMQMPVMNGLEAVRRLRQVGFDLPVIALTADAMKGERQKCIDAGCDDYLTKPIDVNLLTETIAKHLGECVE